MTDNDILKYFCGPKLKHIQQKKYENIPNDIEYYLKNRFNDSLSYRETIIRILHKIDVHPKCPICGNPCRLHPYKSKFLKTCDNKDCSIKYLHIQREETMLKRYGYKNSFQNPEILKKSIELSHSEQAKEHAKQTCLERYGIEHYTNRQKCSETCSKRTNEDRQKIVNKIKQTKLEKYGNENYVNHDKAKQTCLKRYGKENYFQTNEFKEKYKQMCLERYGVDNILKSKDIQKKIHENQIKKFGCLAFNSYKQKETNLKKYGHINPFGSKEIQAKIKETRIKHFGQYSSPKLLEKNKSPEVQIKRNLTKKKNDTYNKSKYEDQSYELLKEKYNDVIRQYSSELYPFNCDFYIPSLDLYIECNYSQYHCKHPFDKNNKDDLLYLEELKERAAKSERHKIGKDSQYDNMIYTWTDLDVRKFNIAKQNNLNYKVFYKLNDLKKYIEEQ